MSGMGHQARDGYSGAFFLGHFAVAAILTRVAVAVIRGNGGQCHVSLWIPKRDKTGRVYYFVVELPIMVILAIVAIGVSLLVSCVATAPVESMLSFLAVTGIGFFLFAVAKVSVFRQGELVSFGSARMSAKMKTAYRTGWVLMAIGATLTLLAVWIASRMQSGL